MKIHFILFFFLLFTLLHESPSWAYQLPEECLQIKNKDCVTCSVISLKKTVPDKVDALSRPMQTLADYSFLESEVEKLSKVNHALKKSLVPLFRTLRDGQSEPTYKESRLKIDEIKNDFEKLTMLSRESLRLQKKFDLCISNCSSVRRIEIEDEIKQVQKLKSALFLSQPILANKVFEKRMSAMDEKMVLGESLYSDAIFETDLKEALFVNLQKLDKRDSEFFLFQNDGKKPYRPEDHSNYVKDYTIDVASRFPGIIEDLVKSVYFEGAYSKPETKTSACFYAQQFKKFSERKEYEDMAIDAGLFVLPMFAGPIGRGGALGAELIFGERLALWGLRSTEAKRAMNAASLVFQAGTVASDVDRLKNLSEECRAIEVRFLARSTKEQLDDVKACQKKLGDKIFMTELSLIAAGTANISSSTLKFLGHVPATKASAAVIHQEVKSSDEIASRIYSNGLKLEKNQIGLEFKTSDSGVFSVMDLKAVSQAEEMSVKKIPEDYWRYVGNIYNERLNLTPTEVEGFIKSSVEMSPRTKLILNTEKSPLAGNMKINGGVGIVEAGKKGELLPLEKATGVRIHRKPDEKIVEIVRLTVGKDVEAEKMSKALIKNAVSLITQDKSISRVFIFTSKVHARLYKRMGIPADKIKDIDKRDVLIEMTRSELERVMKEKNSLEKIQSYLPALLKISSKIANI